jgi:hypothetical protein
MSIAIIHSSIKQLNAFRNATIISYAMGSTKRMSHTFRSISSFASICKRSRQLNAKCPIQIITSMQAVGFTMEMGIGVEILLSSTIHTWNAEKRANAKAKLVNLRTIKLSSSTIHNAIRVSIAAELSRTNRVSIFNSVPLPILMRKLQ